MFVLQKQLDDLEREKEALLATNVRLNRDVQKLGSENRLLHEKNVELGDEILRNHSDLSDLQEQLNLVNFSNQSSDGEPMSIVPMPEESAAETLTEIARDNGEDADDEESWESLTAEVMKTSANMTVLKDELLRQQEQLKSFVQVRNPEKKCVSIWTYVMTFFRLQQCRGSFKIRSKMARIC